jgi:prophage regulatory protein
MHNPSANKTLNSETRERLVRKRELIDRLGVSGTTIWRMERRGEFPRSIRVSAGAVAWRESDLQRWITERAESRR